MKKLSRPVADLLWTVSENFRGSCQEKLRYNKVCLEMVTGFKFLRLFRISSAKPVLQGPQEAILKKGQNSRNHVVKHTQTENKVIRCSSKNSRGS